MRYIISSKNDLDGRAYWLCMPEEAPETARLPVLYWAGGDGESLQALLPALEARAANEKRFALAAFSSEDWNRDFSPWPAPALSGKAPPFAGEAPETLAWILDRLIPAVEGNYPVLAGAPGRALMGYSLGGLFALWASLSSDHFPLCASCSGSLWFDGWLPYLNGITISPKARVFLSLGMQEGKARNQRMAAVKPVTEDTYAYLQASPAIADCTLAWNEGGHFHDTAGRIAQAVAWLYRA